MTIPENSAQVVAGTTEGGDDDADPAVRTTFPGIDVGTYPGNSQMATWKTSSPFYFTGYYLAPAPYHTDTSWMGKRATLASQGWGFAILYVGQQSDSSHLTVAQGNLDSASAISLATSEGFPKNAIIFLDVEQGGELATNFLVYIRAWAAGIIENGNYDPGIYCNTSCAAQIEEFLQQSGVGVIFWCVNVNCTPSPGCTVPTTTLEPSTCGYSTAQIWQYAQSPKPTGVSCGGYTSDKCRLTYGGVSIDVDLDTSTEANPSHG